MTISALADQIKHIVKRLGALAPQSTGKPETVPMALVAEAVLLDAADRQAVRKAMTAIEQAFVDFNEFRVAGRDELATLLEPIDPALVDQAEALTGVLNDIITERHSLTLDYLIGEPRPKVEAALARFGHLSDTATAYIMLHGLGHNIVAVTHGMHRVLDRLGLAEPDTTAHELQKKLDRAAARTDVYPLCEGLIEIAATVCFPKNPHCPQCRLLPNCPEGQRRTAGGKTAKTASKPAAKQAKAAPATKGKAAPAEKAEAKKPAAKQAPAKAVKNVAKKPGAAAAKKISKKP